MTRDIHSRQEAVVRELEAFDDWMDRYQYLIEQADSLPSFPDEYRTDDHLLPGCQSRVWAVVMNRQGRVSVRADSDARITRGLIALLVRVLDNQRAEDILGADLFFLEKSGLRSHLSPSRANGLAAIIRHLRTEVEKLRN